MAKVWIPKSIRNDPKVQEVLGSPQPQPKEKQEFRPRGNYYRQQWLMHRVERKCEKCGSIYMPNVPNQKYCPHCSTIIRRKTPEGNRNLCKCGRHSSQLDEFHRCSFCRDRDNKLKSQMRAEERYASQHKKKKWVIYEDVQS